MAEEKRLQVVYRNGFRAEYRKSVADVLLKRGSVEPPAQYNRRLDKDIAEKKPEDEPVVDDEPVDDEPPEDEPAEDEVE